MIFINLAIVFFKIGLLTFGGGYAMIPMLQSEVQNYNWMTEAELMDFIAISESTPGPIAINLATFVGLQTAGLPGSIVATFFVVLPSFILVLFAARLFFYLEKNQIFRQGMQGIRAAVVGLIFAAGISMAKIVFFPETISASVFAGTAFWFSLLLFAFDFFAAVKKLNPILILLISAGVGIAYGYADKLLF